MVKASRSGSARAGAKETQAGNKVPTQPAKQDQDQGKVQSPGKPTAAPTATGSTGERKGKSGGGKSQPKIGGTAVVGAKSMQPKELSTGTPPDQQPEYYNRDMRRRMQHMGTGPYSQNPALDARARSKKRKERLKERQEQVKQLVDKKGPSRDVRLGRRNTYFLIGIAALIVILIVIFILVRHFS